MSAATPITTILLAALARPDAAHAPALRAAVRAVPDWNAVLATARVHRLSPLLYSRLHAQALLGDVPPAARNRLTQLHLASAARQARLEAALLRWTALLKSLAIPVLPMRGPLLAAQLGFDPAARQCDDLDLLLHRADLPHAREALLAAGCVPVNAPPTTAAREHMVRAGGGLVFAPPDAAYQIDLAWTVTPRYFAAPITFARLLPHAERHRTSGADLPALNRAALAVTLCAHGSKHLWSRHAWTHDVAALLAQPDTVDWEQALRLARTCGAGRMLLMGVAWAAQASAHPAPPALAARIARDRGVTRRCEWLAAQFARDAAWSPRDDADRARFHLALQPGPAARLRYLAWRAFSPSPNDWRARALPDACFGLYALARPGRLAARALRRRGHSTPPAASHDARA